MQQKRILNDLFGMEIRKTVQSCVHHAITKEYAYGLSILAMKANERLSPKHIYLSKQATKKALYHNFRRVTDNKTSYHQNSNTADEFTVRSQFVPCNERSLYRQTLQLCCRVHLPTICVPLLCHRRAAMM